MTRSDPLRGLSLRVLPWAEQAARWPATGRVILAQADAETVVVYQAFAPEIGRPAAAQQRFGPGFSRTRMSWIKPNFLWMMHRSSWGTAAGQETVLAIRLRRAAFDTILARAVPSSFAPALYEDEAAWRAAVAASEVRLQWDPDWSPADRRQERRAIQLGMRGETLAAYASEWIVGIEDITAFVHAQHALVRAGRLDALVTPHEEPYPVAGPDTARRLGAGRA